MSASRGRPRRGDVQDGAGFFDEPPETDDPETDDPETDDPAETDGTGATARTGPAARRVTRRLVVEADGGSRGNPGPAAYGALVRDADTGEVLDREGLTLGRATNNVAEYSGLIAGLEMVRGIDADASVDVRMDSKLVVEQMAGRWKVKHPAMIPLARRASALRPARVSWTWVPRADNKDADALVNAALDGDPVHRQHG